MHTPPHKNLNFSQMVKGSYSQSYGLSRSHIWMWELDHKEGWALKKWCFWTVVLKKILESPLGSKEIKPVNPEWNQPWVFLGRNEAEAPILWPPHGKRRHIGKDPDAGKDWGQEERGWYETVGWHYGLNGHEFEQTPRDSEGQRSLVCCSLWGPNELDTIEQLNNNKTTVCLFPLLLKWG